MRSGCECVRGGFEGREGWKSMIRCYGARIRVLGVQDVGEAGGGLRRPGR